MSSLLGGESNSAWKRRENLLLNLVRSSAFCNTTDKDWDGSGDRFEESELTHLKNRFVGSFYNFYRSSTLFLKVCIHTSAPTAPQFSRDPIWFLGKCYVMNVAEVDTSASVC